MTAGSAVDQLIQDYADQPVAFIEYDVLRAPGFRQDRFYEAWYEDHEGYAPVPRDMVDSGYRISAMGADQATYYATFKGMVDAALARPAYFGLAAVTRRVGDNVEFRITVTNQSTMTLAATVNSATVHGVVYEQSHVRLTNQFGREAGFRSVESPLEPGESADYTLTAYPLATSANGYGWDKMRALVMLDYRPGAGNTGPYDMLQAAAAPGPLAPVPSNLTFLASLAGPEPVASPVALQGAAYQSWTATTDVPWLRVSPDAGTATEVPSISVVLASLSPGWQEGIAYFSATDAQGKAWSAWVTVRAYAGAGNSLYLPMLLGG